MQHLIHLHTPRLIRQRRARSKRAAQAALDLLDPAVAQPVATTEDYENLRARLSFESGSGSGHDAGGGPRAGQWWLSAEEAVMGREGDDRRGGGQKDMWAMARGPWRFNARGSTTALALQQSAEDRRGGDVDAAAAAVDGAAGEDGWEVLEVGDVRRDMDLDVGSVGGSPLAGVRRSGKGMMAVWV